MARINIELHVDETGAVKGISTTEKGMESLQRGVDDTERSMSSLGGTMQITFGVLLAKVFQNIASRLRTLAGDFSKLLENIQDTDGAFQAMWNNNRRAADEFVSRFRELTGFTLTESRKIATELGGIARSMGLAGDEALEVAERSATLALRWEQLEGLDFDRALNLVTMALTGNAGQLQRLGLLTRQQAIEFRNMESITGRLNVITESLTTRYGNLEDATDGITQKKRRLSNITGEMRDQILRSVIPSYQNFLEELIKVSEGSKNLSDIIAELTSTHLVNLLEFTTQVVQALKLTDEELENVSSGASRFASGLKLVTNVLGTLLSLRLFRWLNQARIAMIGKSVAASGFLTTITAIATRLPVLGAAYAAWRGIVNSVSREINRQSESLKKFNEQDLQNLLDTLDEIDTRVVERQLKQLGEREGELTERTKELRDELIRLIIEQEKLAGQTARELSVSQGEFIERQKQIENRIKGNREQAEEYRKELARVAEAMINLGNVQGAPDRDPLPKPDIKVIEEVTKLTQKMVDEWIGFKDIVDDPPDFEATMDAALKARDVILRFTDDGRVSIAEMNTVLQELNEEILNTGDPQRRQGLIQYRESLAELRDEAQRTKQEFVNLSEFMQSTMANAVNSFLVEFTNAFQHIGTGPENFARAFLDSILSVIRGIGHAMIAQGTAMLLGAYTFGIPDPRGKALIAKGVGFAAMSSLGMGLAKGGGDDRGAASTRVGGGVFSGTTISASSSASYVPVSMPPAAGSLSMGLTNQRMEHHVVGKVILTKGDAVIMFDSGKEYEERIGLRS